MKCFSFDAVSNEPWGQAFAIAALAYDENGNEVARFIERLDDEITSWVRKNIPVAHESYDALLASFANFYTTHNVGAEIVVHTGYAEAKILRDMHVRGLLGDWDDPYPLFVSGNQEKKTHNPLRNSARAAQIYHNNL